jgi:hypothetical protein
MKDEGSKLTQMEVKGSRGKRSEVTGCSKTQNYLPAIVKGVQSLMEKGTSRIFANVRTCSK